MNSRAPPSAKLVGGVWLPKSDQSFEGWMLRGKRVMVIDGKYTYQYHKLEAAMKHQPQDRRGVCVDIGAHVGLWSMWLVREFEWVHAFEPVPAFADIFPHNVDMGRATLRYCALGHEQEPVNMIVPDDFTGSARVATARPHPGLKKHHRTGAETVWSSLPQRRLDDFEFDAVDFIKIDVEGYEWNVVRGAELIIRRCRPNIVVEQAGNDLAYGHERDSAKHLLESWGMVPIHEMSGDWLMGW